ncbi:MAG: sigma-70 family RNA polymerase sigma factor [Oscillospiraceae bacterium]|nr:sigma-70 family RNA polymerase sigma factor [Oscillospiraceae bacterium]
MRGLEYEDLYQCGCLALCKAAYYYDGRVKFETFAGTVIRNALLDECRKAKSIYSHSLSYDASVDPDDDDGDTFAGMLGDTYDMTDRLFSEELMSIVQTAKKTHKGAVLKGIEAIELRIKGYTGAEIAQMYGVKNNNVSSWISKAVVVLKREHPEYAYQ